MRRHRCNWLNCRELVSYDKKFCSIHEVANQKQREHYMAEQSANLKGTLKGKHQERLSQQKYDAEVRDETATAFYHSQQWIKLSHYIKVKQAYTSEVSHRLLDDNDTQVDHIVKRSLLPTNEWYNPNNLWLLSRQEHYIKSNIERHMIKTGKQDVLRHLSKNWWAEVIREKLNEGNKQ